MGAPAGSFRSGGTCVRAPLCDTTCVTMCVYFLLPRVVCVADCVSLPCPCMGHAFVCCCAEPGLQHQKPLELLQPSGDLPLVGSSETHVGGAPAQERDTRECPLPPGGTPLCPAPHISPPPGPASFQRRNSKPCTAKAEAACGFSCPAPRPHPPPSPGACCAFPSARLGVCAGNFPGHLDSRLCVNCFVSSLPIHLRTRDRVTLPHCFTPGPTASGRHSQGPGEQVERGLGRTVATTRWTGGTRSCTP